MSDILRLDGQPVTFACDKRDEEMAAADPGPRRFRMLAYTGAPVDSVFMPMVVDLGGMEFGESMPILVNHDANQIAGMADTVEVREGQLFLEGDIYDDEEAGAKALRLSARGFPWQASMGFAIDKVEEIDNEEEREVNGRKVMGPALVATRSRLMESSFVPLGRDPATSAAAFAAAVEQFAQQSKKEETAMAESKQKATIAELRAEFGSRPEFVLDAIERGVTIETARNEWQALELAEAREALAAKEKAEAEARERFEAQQAELKAELAKVKAEAERFAARGHEGVPHTEPTTKPTTTVDEADPVAAEWNADANLRKEFGGDMETYRALRRAEISGLVRYHAPGLAQS